MFPTDHCRFQSELYLGGDWHAPNLIKLTHKNHTRQLLGFTAVAGTTIKPPRSSLKDPAPGPDWSGQRLGETARSTSCADSLCFTTTVLLTAGCKA